ncbi:hypothetical protein [Methylocapsa acidiphila]|uniref:hypothetical protein n=1 Tax=Methylocapsa acidiphila TaxID=133552 RepID=UPI00041D928D|nr:hypothetical protein [Methylocapsa acidiphila]
MSIGDEDLGKMSLDELRSLKQRVEMLLEEAAKQSATLVQRIEGAIEIDALDDLLKKIDLKLLENG